MKKDSLAKFGPALWEVSEFNKGKKSEFFTKVKSLNFTPAPASQKARQYAAAAAK